MNKRIHIPVEFLCAIQFVYFKNKIVSIGYDPHNEREKQILIDNPTFKKHIPFIELLKDMHYIVPNDFNEKEIEEFDESIWSKEEYQDGDTHTIIGYLKVFKMIHDRYPDKYRQVDIDNEINYVDFLSRCLFNDIYERGYCGYFCPEKFKSESDSIIRWIKSTEKTPNFPSKDKNDRNDILTNDTIEANIKKIVPQFDKYNWFLFHTGYVNYNSDILVVHKISIQDYHGDAFPTKYKLTFQNIEIKRFKDSWLFQPQFKYDSSSTHIHILGMTTAYLNRFGKDTMDLEQIFMNALVNNDEFQTVCNQDLHAVNAEDWLDRFMHGRKTAYLIKDILLTNVEEIIEKYYLHVYDKGRSVNVMQIGNGKDSRLFRIGTELSNKYSDPLELLHGRTNALSSCFKTISLSIEIRKMKGNKKYGLYGKMKFSNKRAVVSGSFDPKNSLPK